MSKAKREERKEKREARQMSRAEERNIRHQAIEKYNAYVAGGVSQSQAEDQVIREMKELYGATFDWAKLMEFLLKLFSLL